jgi:hypothetical protein
MEQRFHVTWEIDVYAETPEEAAQAAWDVMGKPDSTTNYFEVYNQDGVKSIVDLGEEP